jgi:hypothetical protein
MAVAGAAIFHIVSMTTGKVAIGDGLGWDGRSYALMVTEGLHAGSVNMQLRPLLPLLTRAPFSLGMDVLAAFHLINHLYAFALYFVVARLLERRGVRAPLRAAVVLNLALCIATSKMFGFYPAQIDLGALAVVTTAFYYVSTDRRLAATIACVLAAASREFGIVVTLYGIHRALRQRRPWREIAWMYLPGIGTAVALRLTVLATTAPSAGPLSWRDALANLGFWLTPQFPIVFAYFAVTLFGGISALLFLRAGSVASRLRAEPELATFLLVVTAFSAVGSLDIWRYLAFALPVAVALIAGELASLDDRATAAVVACMTLITVITQQPFAFMDENIYFRAWFPLYVMADSPLLPGLLAEWAARIAALLLVLAASRAVLRRGGVYQPRPIPA